MPPPPRPLPSGPGPRHGECWHGSAVGGGIDGAADLCRRYEVPIGVPNKDNRPNAPLRSTTLTLLPCSGSRENTIAGRLLVLTVVSSRFQTSISLSAGGISPVGAGVWPQPASSPSPERDASRLPAVALAWHQCAASADPAYSGPPGTLTRPSAHRGHRRAPSPWPSPSSCAPACCRCGRRGSGLLSTVLGVISVLVIIIAMVLRIAKTELPTP